MSTLTYKLLGMCFGAALNRADESRLDELIDVLESSEVAPAATG